MAPRRRGSAAIGAWSLAGLYLVASGVGLWLSAVAYARHVPTWFGVLSPEDVMLCVVFLPFVLVGAVIVSRRPRHAVGWVMVVAALVFAVRVVARNYAFVALGRAGDPPALAALAAWLDGPLEALAVILAFVVLPLVYPDGRLSLWPQRILAAVAGVLAASWVTSAALTPVLHGVIRPDQGVAIEVYRVANPVGAVAVRGFRDATGEGIAIALPLMVLVGTAVVVRFVGSRGVERQQMKWFAAAGTAIALGAAYFLFFAVFGDARMGVLGGLVMVVVLSAYPIAIGVAVLRYRLYEIDRLISRTVAYGLVIVVLGAIYGAGVVGLGAGVAELTGEESSDLVVAASVLVVVALFRPVSARAQGAVDRRFNRTGYEARLAVEAFGDRLRDEVELEAIRHRLETTAAVAVQPSRVSVWLAAPQERR